MAIVKIKKITVLAHKKNKNKILKTLTDLGTVEIAKTEIIENAEKLYDSESMTTIDYKLNRLDFAFSFLKNTSKILAKEDKKNNKIISLKKENILLNYDSLCEIEKESEALFSVIDELETVSFANVDLRNENSKSQLLKEQILPYKELDINFSDIKDTKYAFVEVGLIPKDKWSAVKDALPVDIEIKEKESEKNILLAIVGLKERKEIVLQILNNNEYQRCTFDYKERAIDILAIIENKRAEIEQRLNENLEKAKDYLKYLDSFEKLYDFYVIEKNKAKAYEICQQTEKTFILTAYAPFDKVEMTLDAVNAIANTIYAFEEDLKDGDIPPTLLKERKVVDPFDTITSTFGSPSYKELDPNPFVAIFYFLFFGIMISDAGYGLIIAIACFLFLKIKKPVKKSGQMIAMFMFCGISTVIWGTLFGGWFGISSEMLEANAFGRFLLSLSWFSPLEEPLIMFGLALGLGVVQIGTGFFLNGYQKLKTAPLDGIFNDFSWVTIFVGAGIALIGMAVKTQTVSTIGLVLSAIGFVMLLIGGTIGKKGIMKKLSGSFKNVYGIINIVSDILSYSRVFGLGLTTGVIGLVVNMIAGIIGFPFSIIVLLVGHTFNLAINMLGAYVHNSRLQYIEFFQRFYDGSGHAFKSLSDGTKYLYIEDKLQ